MNHYIYAQILNMQAMAKTFGQSCELAAMKLLLRMQTLRLS